MSGKSLDRILRIYDGNRDHLLYSWKFLSDGSILVINQPDKGYHTHFFPDKNNRIQAVITAEGTRKGHSKANLFTLAELTTLQLKKIGF